MTDVIADELKQYKKELKDIGITYAEYIPPPVCPWCGAGIEKLKRIRDDLGICLGCKSMIYGKQLISMMNDGGEELRWATGATSNTSNCSVSK